MLPLHQKHVAFVGTFPGGSLPLKDIVYLAGGAPVDTVAAFTDYLVIGRGGKDTQLYRKQKRNIDAGFLVAISSDELRDIADGKMPAPERRTIGENVVVIGTEEAKWNAERLNLSVWQDKRDRFVERYGEPQSDGSRLKMNLTIVKALMYAAQRGDLKL